MKTAYRIYRAAVCTVAALALFDAALVAYGFAAYGFADPYGHLSLPACIAAAIAFLVLRLRRAEIMFRQPLPQAAAAAWRYRLLSECLPPAVAILTRGRRPSALFAAVRRHAAAAFGLKPCPDCRIFPFFDQSVFNYF